MGKLDIHAIVREEVDKLIKEAKEKAVKDAPKIEQGLCDLHKKLLPEMIEKGDLKTSNIPLETRLPIKTVADLLDIPVNSLMLFFLNNVKLKNTRSPVEYHMGQVHFYAI